MTLETTPPGTPAQEPAFRGLFGGSVSFSFPSSLSSWLLFAPLPGTEVELVVSLCQILHSFSHFMHKNLKNIYNVKRHPAFPAAKANVRVKSEKYEISAECMGFLYMHQMAQLVKKKTKQTAVFHCRETQEM